VAAEHQRDALLVCWNWSAQTFIC